METLNLKLEQLNVEIIESKNCKNAKNDYVVANILSEGTKFREYTKGVENNLRKVELDLIQLAESKLAKFVEDIIVPPRMVDIVVDREVNDEHMRTLEILIRQKAVSKVFDFIVQKLYALRKPKTNIQILQHSVLLKYN
nr:vacuolar protein sorting-associated protein 52 a [Quercus suber]